MTPVRTSPVPAVASEGGPSAATSAPSPGAATSASAPFSRHDAAEALGRLGDSGEAVRGDPGGLAAEQPAELALVRGQHDLALPVERLEPEEPVGVDDSRQRRLFEQAADERLLLGRPPEARADRERVVRVSTASSASASGRFTASSRCGRRDSEQTVT